MNYENIFFRQDKNLYCEFAPSFHKCYESHFDSWEPDQLIRYIYSIHLGDILIPCLTFSNLYHILKWWPFSLVREHCNLNVRSASIVTRAGSPTDRAATRVPTSGSWTSSCTPACTTAARRQLLTLVCAVESSLLPPIIGQEDFSIMNFIGPLRLQERRRGWTSSSTSVASAPSTQWTW